MKRILTMLFLLALTISIFSVSAFAADSEPIAPTGSPTITEADGETIAPTDSETVFDEIYNKLLTHSDKILSALAFFASLFLLFAYKKGILPLIRGGLNTLSGAVGSLKEESKRVCEISEKSFTEAKDKLDIAEKALSELTKKLETVESELSKTKDIEVQALDFKLVLQTQSELLYEIFMSSSIPAYLKESVGERMCAMRKVLSESEAECDE